ncbi:hypothetical protein [Aquimarina megaterium]|uniref:hypothetical protein n=1 Tax=Aquimarina megaterium TaxID=1443666 RepID=UPI00158675D6|nr:hypothetical protein [Aquimarina megaterium]
MSDTYINKQERKSIVMAIDFIKEERGKAKALQDTYKHIHLCEMESGLKSLANKKHTKK